MFKRTISLVAVVGLVVALSGPAMGAGWDITSDTTYNDPADPDWIKVSVAGTDLVVTKNLLTVTAGVVPPANKYALEMHNGSTFTMNGNINVGRASFANLSSLTVNDGYFITNDDPGGNMKFTVFGGVAVASGEQFSTDGTGGFLRVLNSGSYSPGGGDPANGSLNVGTYIKINRTIGGGMIYVQGDVTAGTISDRGLYGGQKVIVGGDINTSSQYQNHTIDLGPNSQFAWGGTLTSTGNYPVFLDDNITLSPGLTPTGTSGDTTTFTDYVVTAYVDLVSTYDFEIDNGGTFEWQLGGSGYDSIEFLSGDLVIDGAMVLELNDEGTGGVCGVGDKFYLFKDYDNIAGTYSWTADATNVAGNPNWDTSGITFGTDATGIYFTGLSVVPEPATLVLLGIGGLGLLLKRRR